MDLRVVALWLATLALALGADYPTYSPGPQVKRWQDNEFETDEAYMTKVLNRIIALAVFGGLFCLIIGCWSCCRCCCGNCRVKHVDEKDTLKMVLLVVMAVLMISSIALLISGLALDRKQSDALQSVSPTINTLTSWSTEITFNSNQVKTQAATVKTSNAALKTATTGYMNDPQDIGAFLAIDTAMDELVSTMASVTSTADSANFDSFSDDIGDQMDTIDKSRSQAVRTILALLLTVILLQGLIGVLNATDFCFTPKKIKACWCCISPLLSIVSYILLVLLWVLACVLLTLTTGVADFCFEADTNFLDVTNTDTDATVRFFVLCDEDPTIANPFQSDIDTLVQNLQQATQQGMDVITTGYQARCEPNSVCKANAEDDYEKLQTDIDSLVATVGQNTDSDPEYETGLVSLIGCSSVNRRYQALVILICDDFAEALGTTFEIVLGFAVFYTMIEVFQRLLSDFGREEGKSDDGVLSNKVHPDEGMALSGNAQQAGPPGQPEPAASFA